MFLRRHNSLRNPKPLFYFLFASVLILFFGVSLYHLKELPGEWYGDISNVHEYTSQILRGEWPFYFFQSPGPLYHYLISPFVLATLYKGYLTYKLASLFVSFLGLLGTYLLAKELFSRRVALITVWLMAFSFWHLVWTRLGNSQIIIPLIFSFCSYFFVCYLKKGKTRHILLSALTASLGWYAYPQTFIFVPLFILGYFYFLLSKKEISKRKAEILSAIFILGVCFIPFIEIVKSHPDNFGNGGYIGGKVIPVLKMDPVNVLKDTGLNFLKTASMIVLEGDETFRVNVKNNPMIDTISFILLCFGGIYLLKQKKYSLLFYIILIFSFLIFPAVLPGTPQGEIPSSSRTIAVQPIIYTLCSLGILFLNSLLRKHIKTNPYFISAAVCTVGFFMCTLNLNEYFFLYAQNLPEQNFAPGKRIAEYLDDKIPQDVSVYFASCCWKEWGEPEPKAVVYVILKKREIVDANISGCQDVKKFPALIIFNPDDQKLLNLYGACFPKGEVNSISEEGKILFKQLMVRSYEKKN